MTPKAPLAYSRKHLNPSCGSQLDLDLSPIHICLDFPRQESCTFLKIVLLSIAAYYRQIMKSEKGELAGAVGLAEPSRPC